MSTYDETQGEDTQTEAFADWAVPHVQAGILIPNFEMLFWGFKQACIVSASELAPPEEWVADVSTYLSASTSPPEDVEKILAGARRTPTYYSGGLVLSLNSDAGAMTLDDCVFVESGEWNPNTYVHEMVHVGQYGAYGVEGFLAAYFGSSALEVIERWARGESVDAMKASYLETEAYDIATRYDAANP